MYLTISKALKTLSICIFLFSFFSHYLGAVITAQDLRNFLKSLVLEGYKFLGEESENTFIVEYTNKNLKHIWRIRIEVGEDESLRGTWVIRFFTTVLETNWEPTEEFYKRLLAPDLLSFSPFSVYYFKEGNKNVFGIGYSILARHLELKDIVFYVIYMSEVGEEVRVLIEEMMGSAGGGT